jgi:hypothetical protein
LTARLRLAALAAAGLVACHPAGDRPGRAVVVDDAGDTLRIERPARRIVSLNPTTTELLFALGAGDRLVGRTEACDYPAAAAGVASVGGWLPPNVEAVAARAPAHRPPRRRAPSRPTAGSRGGCRSSGLTLSESAFTRPNPRAPAAIALLRHRLEPVLH